MEHLLGSEVAFVLVLHATNLHITDYICISQTLSNCDYKEVLVHKVIVPVHMADSCCQAIIGIRHCTTYT